jgi:hypothetical protein
LNIKYACEWTNDIAGTLIDLSTLPGAVSNQLTVQVPCEAIWRWTNRQGVIILRFQALLTISDGMRTYQRFHNAFYYSSSVMPAAMAKSCVKNYFGTLKIFSSEVKIIGPPPANLALCIKAYFRMFGYNQIL